MIKNYGADSVRWFIMSDSPPEKDIQWSDTGVSAANKFLQKIWNLNISVINRIENEIDHDEENKFENKINEYLYKIDQSIIDFRFNVCIALYEIYNNFKASINLRISNKSIKNNFIKLLLTLNPFTPHISNECLETQGYTDQLIWPKIKKDFDQNVKIVIQINGKTRDVLEL